MWYYNDEIFDVDQSELECYAGFVYMITELDTDMKYIGKKLFWKPKILPKNKTRKRRIRTRTESDWRKYFGSNKELKLLVEEKTVDNYRRDILHLCKTKGECSYWEAKLQFQYDVLLREDFYNELIMCRINSKHLKDINSDDGE